MTKNLIFDYATIFVAENEPVQQIDEFEFTENNYQEFLKFFENKSIDYTTQSYKTLEELIKTATKEKYFEGAEEEFEALKKKLAHNKNKDLQTFKDEIIRLLNQEIISRYEYQQGRIKASLKHDVQFEKALNILKNKERYFSILKETVKETAVL